MHRVLKSKPVVLAGGAALVNELLKRRNRRKNRRKYGAAAGITGGLLLAGLVTKYFTNPEVGRQRRQRMVSKLPGKLRGTPERNGEWSTIDHPSPISIPEGTPTQI